MKTIAWDIWLYCNYDCKFCNTKSNNLPIKIYSVDEIFKAWKYIYDKYGKEGLENQGHMPTGTAADIFNMFFGGNNPFGGGNPFGGIFGNMFGGNNMEEPPEDFGYKVNITIQEVYNGCTKNITIPIDVICPTCNGSKMKPGKSINKCQYCNGSGMFVQHRGNMIMQTTCPQCHGRGKTVNEADKCDKCHGRGIIKKENTYKVSISKGTKTNDKYVSNEGNYTPSGKRGRVVFIFIVNDTDNFRISRNNDNNLETSCNVNLIDSLVGASINIKHINLADLQHFITVKKEYTEDESLLKNVFGKDNFKNYLIKRDNLLQLLEKIEQLRKLLDMQNNLILNTQMIKDNSKSFVDLLHNHFLKNMLANV